VDDPAFTKGSLQVIHAPHFIKNGRVNEFIEEILEDANGSLSQEPGCLRFDVLQNIEDPKEIYLYEVYTNSDAFEYHKTTPHIAKWLEATKDMYDDSMLEANGDVKNFQRRIRSIGKNVFPPDNWKWRSL